MKINLKYTENTTRNTDSSRTTNKNLDVEFDMEDASIVESAKVIMEIFNNKDFLNTIKECCSNKTSEKNAMSRTIDWDWEGAFREAIRDIGTPWAIKNIEKFNNSEDEARMLVSKLAFHAPSWISNNCVDCGLKDFLAYNDVDVKSRDIEKIADKIKYLAVTTGFAK